MYPESSDARKKNCTPLPACSSDIECGLFKPAAPSGDEPMAVPVNECVAELENMVEATDWPLMGRSGVLKYSYCGTTSCSV